MQSEGPRCIVSQLIRVCSEEMNKRREKEKEKKRRRKGDIAVNLTTIECVFLETTGNVLGQQCTDDEVVRGRNSIFTTVLERERREWRGNILATAPKHTQSPEHVQCAQDKPSVCINKHHPATTRLVGVCRREARSAPVQPPPIPAHRH